MFHSVYSRMLRKGDGDGGYITYIAGSDARINHMAESMPMDIILGAVDILVDTGYQFRIRTNEYHESLEVSLSQSHIRWQDTQVIQVIGSDPYNCLRDLLVVFYTLFHGKENWIDEALEIDLLTDELVSSQINSMPSNLHFTPKQVELPPSPKKGGKKSNTDESQIPF